ncbi:ABC transporter permease [Streptomyces caniscabiei]|uniref:ABC transporter permease n=1 Tax=Streptomyces caniscabiei TaxID=2746961 RepID=A0A927L2Q2_9ACTN|nr:FtsX-like permease family protein [Streptomyces caniscabiei]MBD9723903.1 ABC transporter permease [Streptomyces caniscabiei]MDX3511444.1 ABC transporter permease [Streptomyces caniscabiei]MDX3718375.1 ABC transporter permease [Streptomyces caniscabiei]WEO22212.1 ABC transporter permease [Streptomyces caniscabiei]
MRSPVLPLTWHLARSSGRRGLQSHLLSAAAAAAGALVLLTLLAAYLGSGVRADRTAWRTPDAVAAKRATAMQTLGTTYVDHRPVTVVSLAQLPNRAATPAPPGLADFPAPGHTYLSPALAELMRALPATRLADRFPTTAGYGTIGAAGLASPEELVAVVGRTPTDPAITRAAEGSGLDLLTARARVDGFGGARPSLFTAFDQQAAVLGGALLVVPVIVLASAAGRLGAARREQRLAALRLAGATPRQILAMTGAESAAVGLVGGLLGAVGYTLLVPVLARVPYGIGPWYAGQLWVGVPVLLAVVAAVAALTSVSAVTTLRGVARSPLGVAQQADPRRTKLIRLVLFVAVGLYVVGTAGGGMSTGQTIALIVLVYGAFWTLGPWVVDMLGRLLSRFARRPATLLAARRLSDDPRGAWRTVSGLVLAGLVAGFFSVGQVGLVGYDYRGQVAVRAAHGDAGELAVRARELLTEAGVKARVETVGADTYDGILIGEEGVVAQVRGGQEQLDTASTALSSLSPGNLPVTQDHVNAEGDTTTRLIGEMGLAVLALGFLVAAASAGLTAAATVLDRRRVYALLRLAGTPLKVLDRARIRETALPLVVLAGGTTATGIYAGIKVNEAFHLQPDASGAVRLALCVALGTATMFAALAGSRPLLRKVTAERAQEAD